MLCDIIVLYCMKKRFYYREKKYKYVEDYEQVGHLLNSSGQEGPHPLLVPVVSTGALGRLGETWAQRWRSFGMWPTQAAAHHSSPLPSAPFLDHLY